MSQLKPTGLLETRGYSSCGVGALQELLETVLIYAEKQMGTSVGILEKHYSKLTATMATEQLG